ncbi:MAG TPA: dihydrodipicolinate synthase family protein [Anaerolineae bacterium]|nr:dihydrodipicolinate synthase family protein [Anaerolineae bacterium]HOQ98038.1 dihydrodipicolinate synthase family protein [Anaerolineae bacterium]HPL29088.1 dihydrodipicolinate synthase family protein [Anaerolineae bacterium]
MAVSLAGVFPPIPTPFDAAGELALDKLAANLAFWNTTGVAGYVVLGSNGEFPFLSEAEKLAVLETVGRHIAPGKLCIAGTGCESARHTIALTRRAAELGAHAALVVTPNYYKPKMDAAAFTAFYQAVADASPIPIAIYTMPAYTGIDISVDAVARLSQHPNIIGMKDSSGSMPKYGDMLRQARPGFQVLAGSASFLFAALCLGASGGVCALANIAPAQTVELYKLTKAGKLAEARALQYRLMAPNAAVTSGYGIAGLKYACELTGLYGGPVRLPLLPLGEHEQARLRATLAEAGLLP